MSLVTMGLDNQGRIAIATYPERVKVLYARRNPTTSLLVMGDEFNSESVSYTHLRAHETDSDLE